MFVLTTASCSRAHLNLTTLFCPVGEKTEVNDGFVACVDL